MRAQTNSRLDGDTFGEVRSLQDCAKIITTTDTNLLASASNVVINSGVGATWINPYDPLGGSWSAGTPSRLIIPRAGVKMISWNVFISNVNDAGSGVYTFLRLNGGADSLINIAHGFDNQGAGAFPEMMAGCMPYSLNANDYLELVVNLVGTTLTRKVLTGSYIAYHAIIGDPS